MPRAFFLPAYKHAVSYCAKMLHTRLNHHMSKVNCSEKHSLAYLTNRPQNLPGRDSEGDEVNLLICCKLKKKKTLQKVNANIMTYEATFPLYKSKSLKPQTAIVSGADTAMPGWPMSAGKLCVPPCSGNAL